MNNFYFITLYNIEFSRGIYKKIRLRYMNQVFSYQLLKEKFNETEESFGATTNQNYRKLGT